MPTRHQNGFAGMYNMPRNSHSYSMKDSFSTVNGVGQGHITKVMDGKTLEDDDFDVEIPQAAQGFGSLTDSTWDLEDMQMPPWAVKLNKRISVLEKLLKPSSKREKPQAIWRPKELSRKPKSVLPDSFYKSMSVFDNPDFPFVHEDKVPKQPKYQVPVEVSSDDEEEYDYGNHGYNYPKFQP